jgi:cytochrome c peroxidase
LIVSGFSGAGQQVTFSPGSPVLHLRKIAEAIAAFESSPEVSPFSAKYDYVMAGKVEFTAEEKAG